jgi:hypothetical protein
MHSTGQQMIILENKKELDAPTLVVVQCDGDSKTRQVRFELALQLTLARLSHPNKVETAPHLARYQSLAKRCFNPAKSRHLRIVPFVDRTFEVIRIGIRGSKC